MSIASDEPREVIVEYMGSRLKVKVAGSNYICPVCDKYYFASVKDLLFHIVAHATSFERKLKPAPRSLR